MFKFNNLDVNKIKFNGKDVNILKYNGVVIYDINEDNDPEEIVINDNSPLTFVSLENDSQLYFSIASALTTPKDILYSTDGKTWNDYVSNTTLTLNEGEFVQFKSLTDTPISKADSATKYSIFYTPAGSFECKGQLNSLFNEKENFAETNYACCRLFQNTNITTAPILSSKVLGEYAYANMFNTTKLLTKAPELPAMTMNVSCYRYMFNHGGLVEAPELPSMSLATECYLGMLYDCQSLIKAQEILPATTLATGCYKYMFKLSNLLEKAPELPAITLVSQCYYQMFQTCSKLNYIKALFTTTPSNTYTNSWVSGVSSTGTYVKNAAATYTTTGTSAIPSGWTVQTATS